MAVDNYFSHTWPRQQDFLRNEEQYQSCKKKCFYLIPVTFLLETRGLIHCLETLTLSVS